MDRELFELWRAWRKTPKPTHNFLSGARSSPSYDLECELDHTIGWIAVLAEELIEGRVRGDGWSRIVDEQVSLENHLIVLDRISLGDEQQERLRSYILQTQSLLEKLARVLNRERPT